MSHSLALPLPQSPQYARTCDALGLRMRVCKRESRRRVRLLWQVQSRRLGPLGRVDMVSRGPVAEDAGDLHDWPGRWRRWHDGRPFLLNADGLSADALRAGGFWPLMTPATVAMLPLDTPDAMRAAMQQKWRNRLNRATRHDLDIRQRPLSSGHWLLAAETAQARRKGYRGVPPAFCLAYALSNPGDALVFEARHKGVPVAGVLVLRHGRLATWQIGHTNDTGRRLNAMNLLLWEAMQTLARMGHDELDLGGLNDAQAPGLSHFKRGTGARAHRLGGTWLHLGCLAPLARLLPNRLQA